MSNVIHLPPNGNPSLVDPAVERLSRVLDLAEAERSAWLAFRARRRTFFQKRTLTAEIVMIEARDRWDSAFRQIEHCGVAAA